MRPITLKETVVKEASKQAPYAIVSLGIVAAYAVALSLWSAFAPVSYWFHVANVRVSDAHVGQTPLVEVERVIKRPFWGIWHATLLEVVPGEVSPVWRCSTTGSNDYRPSATLPPPDEMWEWWFQDELRCLPKRKGSYMIRTTWRIKPLNYPEREISVSSNVFKVD